MRAILTAVSLVVLSPATLAQARSSKAPERTVEPRKWEHEISDLAPDPKITFGALKNGMRYAWVSNSEPKKQILLRLHVNVGSLVETDAELGMAHFVEHMAFNGTTNFKAGTLVATFNAQGIKFGHDVNAHTAMEETVYELDLPDVEPERLKKSMLWFRDVACGLKMEEKEVQAEKGVINAEQRDRDTAPFRGFVSLLEHVLDGTLVPKRLPIGVQEVRAKFNSKACLAFYRRWYRPEHMTFIVVGDLGTLDPTELIETHLGTIPVPKDPPPARPDLGRPTFARKGFALELPGAESSTITIARLRPRPDRPDNAATRAASVAASVGHSMANERFDARQESDKLPYRGISSIEVEELEFVQNLVEGPALMVRCDTAKWKEALMAAERELRRILGSGFTADEFRKAFVQFDRTLVPRPLFPPRHSFEYVHEIISACNERYVPMEDRAHKETFKPGTRGLTVEAATKAYQDEWGRGELVIFTQGGIKLGADPGAELMEIWNAARATSLDQPLAAGADVTAKAGAAGGEDEPGDGTTSAGNEAAKPEGKKVDPGAYAYGTPDVVKDPTATVHRMDDLRVVDITLKNGVKCKYKRSEGGGGFSFGRWEVRVGEGALALDPGRQEVAWIADQVFLRCGLGKNDWETVRAAGGGVHFSVQGDACIFSGAAFGGGDVKRSFEVICAYLTDPGLRQEPFDEFRKQIGEKLKPKEGKESVHSLLGKFREQLYGGERRLTPPSQAAAEAVTLDDVKSFLKSQLDGPITITAVGVDALKLEKAVYSTFSRLPPRRAVQNHDSRRSVAALRTGLREKHTVESGDQSALIHVVYPATDRLDPAAGRRLELLQDVVMDRLRIEIREKRGGAYSPNAGVWGSDTWKGLGWVTLDVQVDPAKVDELTKACTLAMETLGSKGITQAELDRLRTAHLGDVDTALKDDSLWFDALQAAHSRPETFDELRNYKATYGKITVAELNALCKQIFVKGRESVFVAIPKK